MQGLAYFKTVPGGLPLLMSLDMIRLRPGLVVTVSFWIPFVPLKSFCISLKF